MKKQWTVAGAVIVALGTMACAQPPAAEIDAARAAVQAAQAADAGTYAPVALDEATRLQGELDAELAVQQDKMAFLRSYDKAKQAAASLKSAGEAATSAAGTAKEAARQEASGLIERVKLDLVEVKDLVEKAPKGKGSAGDIEALKADLAGVEAALPEIEKAFADGKFKDAVTQAQTALESTGRVRNDVLMAMEAAKGGRRG